MAKSKAPEPSATPSLSDRATIQAATLNGEANSATSPGDTEIGDDERHQLALEKAGRTDALALFRWRKRHALTHSAAAKQLGIHIRTLRRYESGENSVPKEIILACIAWHSTLPSVKTRNDPLTPDELKSYRDAARKKLGPSLVGASTEWKRIQILASEIRSRQKSATDKGDDGEARKLLTTAMGALVSAVKSGDIGEADKISLMYVHESLRQFLLVRYKLERAFGVENFKRGRPRKRGTLFGDDQICRKVDDELDAQERRGEKFTVKLALEVVAKNMQVSVPTLKPVWGKKGGKKGYANRKSVK